MRIRVLVLASLGLWVLWAIYATPARADVLPGDHNGDRLITMDDLPGFVAAWQAAKAGQAWDAAADLDGDHKVTAADADLLFRAILTTASFPTGSVLSDADATQCQTTVAAVDAKMAELGGGAGISQQVVDWAIAQGLATGGGTTSDGRSVSLTLPSGITVGWVVAPGPSGASTTAVRPQDVSTIAPLTMVPPNAVIFCGGFDGGMTSEAQSVCQTLSKASTGYVPYAPKEWGPWTVCADCSGARVVHFVTHGGWGEDKAGVWRPFVMTPQLAYPSQLKNAKLFYKKMCDDGYLTLEQYADKAGIHPAAPRPGTDDPIGYYCITDRFAQKYVKGLDDALVFMNCCEVGTSRWYAALQSNGVKAVAGYVEDVNDPNIGQWRSKSVFSDVAAEFGKAFFELQTAQRGVVQTSDLSAWGVPPGNTADNPFNLGDSATVANTWLPSFDPKGYAASLAEKPEACAVHLAVMGDATWGLIPHLDKLNSDPAGIKLSGDFGDGNGLVQGDNGTGKWDLSLPIVKLGSPPPVQSIIAASVAGVSRVRFALYSGLYSNPLPTFRFAYSCSVIEPYSETVVVDGKTILSTGQTYVSYAPALSPDGKQVAVTQSIKGAPILFLDVDTGAQLSAIQVPQGCWASSPSFGGGRFAYMLGSQPQQLEPGYATVVVDGKAIFGPAQYTGWESASRAVALSPDGKQAAVTGGSWGDPILFLDADTGAQLATIPVPAGLGSSSPSFGGGRFAYVLGGPHLTYSSTTVVDGKAIFSASDGNYQHAALSPDGKQVAVMGAAYGTKPILFLDADTGAQLSAIAVTPHGLGHPSFGGLPPP